MSERARLAGLLAEAEDLLASSSPDEPAARAALARLDAALLETMWEGALARATPRGRRLMSAAAPRLFYRRALARRLARRGAAGEGALRLLFASAWSAHLVLFVTRACQLRCAYCSLRKSSGSMSAEIVDRAVDFALDTRQDEVQLQFFGGEPLLAFGAVRRAVLRAEKAAARLGKRARFFLSTNGLALDAGKAAFLAEHRVRVELSCDGPEEVQLSQRGMKSGGNYYRRVIGALDRLRFAGADYHATAVVVPERAGRAGEQFDHIVRLGHPRVQLNYALGRLWSAQAADAFAAELRRVGREAERRGAQLLNLTARRREPVALNSELIAGCDGRLYRKSGVYFESGFEDLAPVFHAGPLDGARDLDRWGATRFDELALQVKAYAGQERRLAVTLNNVALGARLARALPAAGGPA